LEQLTADHGGQVLKIIMDAVNAETEEGKEDEVQKASTPLRQISNNTKDVVPDMEADDKIMKELIKKVANAKTEAMRHMKVQLRAHSLNAKQALSEHAPDPPPCNLGPMDLTLPTDATSAKTLSTT
jgi:hypothetical protein